MITVSPATLEGNGVRLEPLSLEHHDGLVAAASDGRLWELWFTSVPGPEGTRDFINTALEGAAAGHRGPVTLSATQLGAGLPR